MVAPSAACEVVCQVLQLPPRHGSARGQFVIPNGQAEAQVCNRLWPTTVPRPWESLMEWSERLDVYENGPEKPAREGR